MNKFTPGQRIRTRNTHEDLGAVVWQAGGVVRSSNEMHYFARDIEAVPGEAESGPATFQPGDLCLVEGAEFEDAAVLVGRNLKLVWKTKPARRGETPAARVELRRLDGSYVTTVAIGAVTPGHLMLAMPYLDDQYGERPEDWALSESTIEELYPTGGGPDAH